MSNKYQIADVVSNDENVTDVEVSGINLNILYPDDDPDLSWVGGFLEKHNYELQKAVRIPEMGMRKDIYKHEPKDKTE